MMKHVLPLILSALLFAAAAGGYVYMLNVISGAVDAVAVSRASIASAGEQEAFTKTAQAFLNDTALDRAELGAFIAQDADFVSVIELIEAAAKREKVDITIGSANVVPGGTKFYEQVDISLSAKGSFAALTSFLTVLESLPVASRVTTVSMEASSDKTWFEGVTLEFIKKKATP